ncbi:preprotein translocase subunit SecG [Rhodoblastus acidophilus]|uniref:preprotein translocase subunit SecG n=1 Tax=Rhodoblastus acidophilus TaxID=1074 RepID=UPI00161E1D24|nr:preprotein translocase subunit SecG [Rhodoblastus acidophilus]MCW2284592.1 preprotein translocase subunit SecG [Rhodoblastus acidophilus]MCW2333545.1 preprotein translocase subunit SecG [Rhodoblastus acidophilus]
MQTVLIVVHMLIVVALIVTILLQRSEGGALGIGGGSGSFFTGRGQASALTRATAILAFLFFATSLGLTILASYTRTNTSVFEQPASTAPAGETKGEGGKLMDQLKKLEQPAAPTPAAPEPQAPPRSQ